MATSESRAVHRGKTLGILVGGGPAPGINGVIRAATIEAREAGLKVYGLRDGCRWLVKGDTKHVLELDVDDVSRIHYLGGSVLGTSRVNPTKQEEDMARTIDALTALGVDFLVTIGGDDTANTAQMINRKAENRIRVAHVPKTIDNDLPLPGTMPTFGYQTARHLGCALVQNILEDATTTARWYYLVVMGRSAGHLALGVAKAASATLAIIPEEFRGKPIRFGNLCDILEGAVLKRKLRDRNYGVVCLAEGLAAHIPPEDLQGIDDVERDAHGNIRFAEIELGRLLKNEVRKRLKARGVDVTIVDKNIGYELRCQAPIPYDMEYTQDLGFAAVRYLLEGGNGAMICMIDGKLVPIGFDEMLDPQTKKTKVRRVDVDGDYYRVAREYMIRIERSDIDDPKRLAQLALVANTTPEAFRQQFGYLAEPW
ncbi:MAG: 6-phosphofructokinase [Deltaproteobacteria bacterium]|nr:6-phosphofructokinase [Deltaproteobacteria bacterium]